MTGIFVIFAVGVMGYLLDFSSIGYIEQALFSNTILYHLIFALLVTAPFWAVFIKYVSDAIEEERYEDIRPCFYSGFVVIAAVAAALAIPFTIWQYVKGAAGLLYLAGGYLEFVFLVLALYTDLYLIACKKYADIFAAFLIGMVVAILSALLFVRKFHMDMITGMLFAVTFGLAIMVSVDASAVCGYFQGNSSKYKAVFAYFKQYRKLMLAHSFFITGLFVPNFVFWTSGRGMVTADSFVSMPSFDTAVCLALMTNLSSVVIYACGVEPAFRERFLIFKDAVKHGKGNDISLTGKRMFRELSGGLMKLASIQFIITVLIFLICMAVMPDLGFGGETLKIYPCLAVGYFIAFMVQGCIRFLLYFQDMEGALESASVFFLMAFAGSVGALFLPAIWYGAGLLLASFLSWGMAYGRLQWLEKNIDVYTFCAGDMIKTAKGKKPRAKVYDRRLEEQKKSKKKKKRRCRTLFFPYDML